MPGGRKSQLEGRVTGWQDPAEGSGGCGLGLAKLGWQPVAVKNGNLQLFSGLAAYLKSCPEPQTMSLSALDLYFRDLCSGQRHPKVAFPPQLANSHLAIKTLAKCPPS